MLVAGSHPQVFVAEKLGDRVNVRAFHPEPACCRVAKIVKAKIRDAHTSARSLECHAHLLASKFPEKQVT